MIASNCQITDRSREPSSRRSGAGSRLVNDARQGRAHLLMYDAVQVPTVPGVAATSRARPTASAPETGHVAAARVLPDVGTPRFNPAKEEP
ncbi:MAG: hypothetical protein AVDCRST_MAG19-2358 [uncultured Thermomicrobiales bacterium]|uniref:Uncharacterized protein n=1 Tax=uncultured Thermomicrobiales bacterium TaxID=1645740 RepID=A0A6J4V505_9BACT|nr:MAG: hypothetical protein AVDCRST_MAG19-2358 [uncultured Thermomicrobiales bacterium]